MLHFRVTDTKRNPATNIAASTPKHIHHIQTKVSRETAAAVITWQKLFIQGHYTHATQARLMPFPKTQVNAIAPEVLATSAFPIALNAAMMVCACICQCWDGENTHLTIG